MKITIKPDARLNKVSRYLYGHFAEHLGRCIYGGIWVGENSGIDNDGGIRLDTVRALKALKLPVLRWPGGCFADNYHWRDGIGPREMRTRSYNLWWAQPETHQFGTDEFMRLCDMIETEPYVCVNVGSGTVEEARSWVEYCNSTQNTTLTALRGANGHPEPYNVKFWGIGNENWGCGGNLTPEYYADLYRRFATYVRATAGKDASLIASGSHPGIAEWDGRFLEGLTYGRGLNLLDYVAVHIYSGGGTSDTGFAEDEYYNLMERVPFMDDYIANVVDLCDSYSTDDHKIGVILDEWGTWFKEATVKTGLYQQNTMQDAIFAAASFHRFHKHEGLFMANMAQTVNVLQALILTRGPNMVMTPTYHVYAMLAPHRDSERVEVAFESPELQNGMDALSVSATRADDGLFVSVVNLDLDRAFSTDLAAGGWQIDEVRQLVADDVHAHNTFEDAAAVAPVDVAYEGGALNFPPASITTIRMKKA